MFFIPLRADIDHFRIPFLSILIGILCLSVYYDQFRNERNVIAAGDAFCQEAGPVMWRMVLQKTMGGSGYPACAGLLWTIHLDDAPQSRIQHYAETGEPLTGLSPEASILYKREVIAEQYRRFEARVPKYETQQLWYQPASWDPWHMITAIFAHSSWLHVVGNLLFFMAFAVTVEMILGPLWYALVVLLLATGSHTFYSIAMLATPNALPTVGLSGVVMGMMAMFVFFLPSARIRCFFWLIVMFRTISIPAWILVAWFFGWDLVDLLMLDQQRSSINLVAHVSGAGIGYLLGLLLFRGRRREFRQEMA